MLLRSGIYFILNKISIKLYIGSATYLARRRSEHFTRLAKNIHHNEHLQRAYNKYGADAFDFIIIELVSLDKLLEREAYFIAKHNSTEESYGYNKCEVGSGMTGRKHSAQTKALMSEIAKNRTPKPKQIKEKVGAEQHRLNVAKGMKARFTGINAEENRIKMSKAAKARWAKRKPLVLTSPPIMIKDLT